QLGGPPRAPPDRQPQPLRRCPARGDRLRPRPRARVHRPDPADEGRGPGPARRHRRPVRAGGERAFGRAARCPPPRGPPWAHAPGADPPGVALRPAPGTDLLHRPAGPGGLGGAVARGPAVTQHMEVVLLRAVQAEPADDLPWLALADWLEE